MAGDQGYHFGALSPVQVLSNWWRATRSTEIRYSHTGQSRCSAAVTREDHESQLTFLLGGSAHLWVIPRFPPPIGDLA
jgi:hypothetical protein